MSDGAFLLSVKREILSAWVPLPPATDPPSLAAAAVFALRGAGFLRDNERARAEADLRDEAESLRGVVKQLREELAIKSSQFDLLCVRAEDNGISEEQIDEIANKAWLAPATERTSNDRRASFGG